MFEPFLYDSFGAVLYDFRYCTAWLGAVGGPESYV